MCVRLCVAVLAAIIASGCSNTLLADMAVAPVMPLAMQPTNEVRTARNGDAVVSQTARVAEAVRIDTTVRGVANAIISKKDIEISAGEQLYQVVLKDRAQEKVYCSMRVTNDVRACASDEDGDGDFDRLWYSFQQGTKQRIGGANAYSDNNELAEPIRYTQLTPAEIEPVTVKINFRTDLIAGAFFEVYAYDKEDRLRSTYPIASIDRGGPFPQVVRQFGAEIEVTSFADGAITYRVLRGIPEDQPVGLLHLESTTTYIYY